MLRRSFLNLCRGTAAPIGSASNTTTTLQSTTSSSILEVPETSIAHTQPYQTISGPALTMQFRSTDLANSPLHQFPAEHPLAITAFTNLAFTTFLDYVQTPRWINSNSKQVFMPPMEDFDTRCGTLNTVYCSVAGVSKRGKTQRQQQQRMMGQTGGLASSSGGLNALQGRVIASAAVEPVDDKHRKDTSIKLTLFDQFNKDIASTLITGPRGTRRELPTMKRPTEGGEGTICADPLQRQECELTESEQKELDMLNAVYAQFGENDLAVALLSGNAASLLAAKKRNAEHSQGSTSSGCFSFLLGDMSSLPDGGFKQHACLPGMSTGAAATEEQEGGDLVASNSSDASGEERLLGADVVENEQEREQVVVDDNSGPDVPPWILQVGIAQFAKNVAERVDFADKLNLKPMREDDGGDGRNGSDLESPADNKLPTIVAHNSVAHGDLAAGQPTTIACAVPKLHDRYFSKPWEASSSGLGTPQTLQGDPCMALYVEVCQNGTLVHAGTYFFA